MIPLHAKDLRSILRRLRLQSRDDHYGAEGPDAQMIADGLEALFQRQDALDERVRRLEGCIDLPTGEPGERSE